MKNAVIYARYSSHAQNEQSIEGQLRECYAFAEKNDIKVIHEYIDRALTGTMDKRPDFLRMIEDSKKGLYKYVIVYQLDRFARNRYDSAIYKAKLKKNDVRVLSAKENITDDASGILMEAVLEGMAEYYSKELAVKVKRGKDISAGKCKYVGGTLHYGYKVDETMNYQIDEREAPYVVKIFEMYANGVKARHIMNWLNEIKIPNNVGRKWEKNSIHRILADKRYSGVYVYNGMEIKDGMPQIVNDELFTKVAAIVAKNKLAPARGRAKVDYILTTKLYCADCGTGMVGVSGKTQGDFAYHYYKCLNRIHGEGCKMKAAGKNKLEDGVIDAVKDKLTDEVIAEIAALTADALEKERNTESITRLEKKLADNKKAIDTLLNTLALGRSPELILDKIDRLKEENAELDYAIAKENSMLFQLSERDIANYLTRIRDFTVGENDIKAKALFVDTFIYKIFYHNDETLTILTYLKDNERCERREIGYTRINSTHMSCLAG
ncbi:recombinase RecD [Clostridia bacterium]|nr:recombinase RecD [Clostridia bacterium]